VTVEPLLRPAVLEDAEGFVRAHEVAWDATLGAILGKRLEELMPFAARVEHFRATLNHASETAQAWVAEVSGEVVGVAVCSREGAEVELRVLYVVPKAWGTGTAARLADTALESVRGDARVAFLWVVDDNARARRFYEREGWAPDEGTRSSVLGPVEVLYRRPFAGPEQAAAPAPSG
jgi:GNAT superfamily N-acetyltransferase